MTHELNGEELIRTAEVALLLGVEPRTLAAWRQRGVGPVPLRLTSRIVRYRRADVLAWAAQRRGVGGGTDAASRS